MMIFRNFHLKGIDSVANMCTRYLSQFVYQFIVNRKRTNTACAHVNQYHISNLYHALPNSQKGAGVARGSMSHHPTGYHMLAIEYSIEDHRTACEQCDYVCLERHTEPVQHEHMWIVCQMQPHLYNCSNFNGMIGVNSILYTLAAIRLHYLFCVWTVIVCIWPTFF